MMKKLMFCVLVLMALTANSQVLPTIVWTTNVGTDYSVSNISTALAANSDVHAAGRTNIVPGNADIIVQCRDSTSAVLWTYTYDNGGYDSPEKIWVDLAGNTYIVGISYDATTNRDYICIVLDNTGSLVWMYRFDGSINGIDEGSDICVDSNGDVYITGRSYTGSYYRTVTVKLDGNTGNPIWQNNFSPASANSEGISMVLANNQVDVIVGSTTEMGSGTTDILAHQINASTGSTGWQVNIDGAANSNDECTKIILAGGNVVLCGVVDNGGSAGNDYTTIKVDASSGAVVFQSDYDFSASDKATSLVRDSTGNIAVTGYVYNNAASVYKYHTVCYDSTGTQIWLNQMDINCPSLNIEPSITCDTIAHHFYVCGEMESPSSRDILVYQITPSGLVGWKKSFDATGDLDAATSIVVNGIGVVFVAANTSQSPGVFQITTLKIAQTPVYFPPDLGTQEPNDPNFVFQKNHGQLVHPNGTAVSQSEIDYYYQGSDPSYYFNKSLVSHILIDKDTIPDSLHRVDWNILGANQLADVYHYEPIDARQNYFGMVQNGITDVRSYRRLFIPEIYPNVDIHHYSNTSGLKTFFVFKTPGESIAMLRTQVEGADSTSVDGNGYLIAYTALGEINLGMVTAYQATFNAMSQSLVQVPLTANWNTMSNNMYGFSLSGYIPFWPVVVYVSKPSISPVANAAIDNLHWATFRGAQGYEETTKNRVDAKNQLYTAGRTAATNYPTTPGAFLANIPSGSLPNTHYGFVDKFDKDGAPIFSTYYGGKGNQCGDAPSTVVLDVTSDSLYNVYIVGYTTASQLLTQTISVAGALNYTANAFASGGSCQDAFIAKLNSTGNALHYASYWGGDQVESFTTVDYSNGKIFVGGGATSLNCPVSNQGGGAHWQTTGGGVFMQLDTSGSMAHTTKVSQRVVDADVDKNGNYYQVATTWGIYGLTSVQGPTGSYLQPIASSVDWTLQRFTAASNALDWSTYIGGNSADDVKAMYIQDSIMAITGLVASTNFTIVKAASDSGEVVRDNDNDFVNMKFDLTTGQIKYSAFHATFHNEIPTGIVIDRNYNMYVSGIVKCGANTGTNTACTPSKFKLFAWPGTYLQTPTGNAFIGAETFLMGYNSNNQRKWTTLYASSSGSNTSYHDDRSSSLAVSPAGRLFMLGYSNAHNNSLPMVQWNSVCYFNNLCADPSTSYNGDPFIAMWDVAEFTIVGIDEHESATFEKSNVILFPNPNNGIFTIRFKNTAAAKTEINVMNLLGQNVYHSVENISGKNEVQLNPGNLSKGVYFVNVSEADKTTIIKFVVN